MQKKLHVIVGVSMPLANMIKSYLSTIMSEILKLLKYITYLLSTVFDISRIKAFHAIFPYFKCIPCSIKSCWNPDTIVGAYDFSHYTSFSTPGPP